MDRLFIIIIIKSKMSGDFFYRVFFLECLNFFEHFSVIHYSKNTFKKSIGKIFRMDNREYS